MAHFVEELRLEAERAITRDQSVQLRWLVAAMAMLLVLAVALTHAWTRAAAEREHLAVRREQRQLYLIALDGVLRALHETLRVGDDAVHDAARADARPADVARAHAAPGDTEPAPLFGADMPHGSDHTEDARD